VPPDWDVEADVVVVGFGAAGACAALEAAAAGCSVLILDRFGGGGATALSGGVVYAGGGTPQQRSTSTGGHAGQTPSRRTSPGTFRARLHRTQRSTDPGSYRTTSIAAKGRARHLPATRSEPVCGPGAAPGLTGPPEARP
jgi:glycine/D-amino acid oxidase-like deaminating enzyme